MKVKVMLVLRTEVQFNRDNHKVREKLMQKLVENHYLGLMDI